MQLTVVCIINIAYGPILYNLAHYHLLGKRYNSHDKEILDYIAQSNDDIQIIQGPAFLLDTFPWLIKFTPNIIYDKIMRLPALIEHTQDRCDFILVSCIERKKRQTIHIHRKFLYLFGCYMLCTANVICSFGALISFVSPDIQTFAIYVFYI